MASPKRTTISVLVPAYNEEANIERAYQAITAVFRTLPDYDYEIIVTDNHSTDRTFALLQELAAGDPRLRVIRFSRNVGYQRSLLMAYKAANGDCSVQIDCDLQDPPELIPQMLTLWKQGHQVVYGVRRSLPDTAITGFTRKLFYRTVRAMSEDDLPLDAGEFRLVDKCIIDELKRVDDTSPYLRGLISSMGFSQVGFEYDRQARIAGTSKFPFKAMLALALDGVLNHSLIPLRIASLVGLTVGSLTFVLMFVYLLGRLVFGQDWPAGFATTTMLLLMSISMNALFLGVIGEYLGRIFMQSKHRPTPVIEKTLNMQARGRIRPVAVDTAPDDVSLAG